MDKIKKKVLKLPIIGLSMMSQCFCQPVSKDGICQLSYRLCEIKHRTIPKLWACYCQVKTYEQYFLNIPRQQAALGYGKMFIVHTLIPT